MKKSVLHRIIGAATSFGLLAFVGGAQALIAGGQPDKGGATPELVLVMFDAVKEVSFTMDLGMYVAPFNPDVDNSKNFFVQAQQDGGYQKFFAALNSDANFKKFLATSTDVANQVWGVFAAGTPDIIGPGSHTLFTTLKSTTTNGVLNENYTNLLNLNNQLFDDVDYLIGEDFFNDLNIGQSSTGGGSGADNPDNSHSRVEEITDVSDYLLYNGSSFDVKGGRPYLMIYTGGQLEGQFGNQLPASLNSVGNSSWFYYLTSSSNDGTEKIAIDEFDNLTNDGYWGLAVDTNGDYILSFTMEGTMTSVASVIGQQRRNRTDFSALYGGVRSLSTPTDEFVGWTPSAVPEPATYGLFGLGLAALAWRRRQAALKA